MDKKVKRYSDVIRSTIIWYAIVPIILVSLIAYMVLFFFGNKLIVKENNNSNKKISESMEENLNEYSSLINNISSDEGLISIIKDGVKPQRIYDALYKFVNKRTVKSNFYVFDKEGNMIISNRNSKPEYISEENPFMWGIFSRMKSKNKEVITMINKVDQSKYAYGILTLGKAILYNNEIIGYIIFDFSEEDIFNLITGYTASDIIITDRHNIIDATNNKYSDQLYRLKNDFRQIDGYSNIDGNPYYIKKTSLKDTSLMVYSITNLDIFNRAFFIGGIFLFVLFLVIFYLMLFISKKVAYSKTITINEIVKAIESIQEGNLDTKLEINSEDEFGIITKAYNKMLVDIKKLIESNKEEVALRMQSEIKELEAQFNPHFLFNTLETIRIMIKLDKEKAGDIIVNLSALLRYGINNEIHSVKLKDDIGYINSYLKILKYRFGDKLQFNINIDDEVLEATIPKLLLQPVIENSIKYGFENKSTINIEITSRIKDEKIYIVIKDDGCGIDKERMYYLKRLLNKNQNDTDTIGLYNIKKRIQLIYGDEYGIEVDSIEGEGTSVTIALPILRKDV
ncbi:MULTISPECIES: sensor histidine kinase [unclassified Clostridium]|jgi:two-component sensor histidine kinase|uniref:sensor histidine kinase n=2 Tax=Clostridium TaxID=1485 RepID=UPI0025C2F4AF|nr:histidine kinase [Clostridium sp.]MCI6693435.1 histidine kinase [Clostridium sp.]MDY4252369.1 histidine kinase [Clostridium sp.]